jgi:threonine dehydratase
MRSTRRRLLTRHGMPEVYTIVGTVASGFRTAQDRVLPASNDDALIELGMPGPSPISIDDVRAARERIAHYMPPSPLRSYPLLDAWVGHGIRVFVKHENFNPTGSFKVRNGLSFMTALSPDDRSREVIAATRGNHGLGIAFAGQAFGVRTTICVPLGNNPDKNAGMRALGAVVHEEGRDYDESLAVALEMQRANNAVIAHSTNDRNVMAGAATMSLEVLEQEPSLQSMVMSVGGGSQAVGAITISRALNPSIRVYGVQASGASAAWESWHARERRSTPNASTFADGLATRTTYDMAFPTLLDGLADFVTVSDAELAESMRQLMSTTHTMVEGAGAAGLAGLKVLAPRLEGQRVGIVISGGNVDEATLARVLKREL